MSVVLAIEPDASQAEALRQILRGRVGAELTVVRSKDAAVAVLERDVPDLILLSALLSPRDEDDLVAHLRTIENAAHLQTLTIPQLRSANGGGAQKSSIFGFGRKRSASTAGGCDPAVFAEQVASYLTRAREVRSEPRVAPAHPRVPEVERASAQVPTPLPAWEFPPATSEPSASAVAPERDAPAAPFAWPAAQVADSVAQFDLPAARLETPAARVDLPIARVEPAAAPVVDTPARTTRSSEDSLATEVERIIRHLGVDPGAIQVEAAAAADTEVEAEGDETDEVVLDLSAAVAFEPSPMTGSSSAEIERVRVEAEERRRAEIAQFEAEADALRETAVEQARAAAEADAREALAAELARARADAEETFAAALNRARADAKQTLAAEVDRAREEVEQARAAELARVRAEAEQTIAQELARVRAEAEQQLAAELHRTRVESERAREAELARVQAELARVRQEADHARRADRSQAQIEAEQIRQAAAREARAVAEAAATRTLQDEIARVRAEANARLAAEMAAQRAEAERRRTVELEEVRAQVAAVRDAAAQQARSAAADAIAFEVARATGIALPRRPAPPADAAGPAAQDGARSSYYTLWRQETQGSAAARAWSKAFSGRWTMSRRRKLAMAASLVFILGVMSTGMASWRLVSGFTSAPAEPEVAAAAPVKKSRPGAAARRVPARGNGTLFIESTPAGATVVVDDAPRGVTPLTLADVPSGTHKIVLESHAGAVTRSVAVHGGERTVVSESIMPGWLSTFCRIPLDVYIAGRRMGTTGDGQILLAPGRHTVTFVSERFGYRESKTVEIKPGGVTSYNVPVPTGVVHVNAAAGAELWIDGERIGEAPLRDVRVAIGPREIVAKHPELGEWRETVTVRYGQATELTMAPRNLIKMPRPNEGLDVLGKSPRFLPKGWKTLPPRPIKPPS